MKSVALVTYHKAPKLTEGDKLLVKPLENAGYKMTVTPWDKKNIDWRAFDAVILRSTWDYHTRYREFLQWTSELEQNLVNVWNPVKTVKWNSDKHYLIDLETSGVPTIPTLYLSQHASVDKVQKLLVEKGWTDIIIKPAIGASAYHVSRVSLNEVITFTNQLQKLLQTTNVLIQPFIPEISQGELSFIFIGGKLTHSVLKKPKTGEYRTNFKSVETFIQSTNDQQQQVLKIYKKTLQPLLYARIDCVEIKGVLTVMEIELIEPVLFFNLYPPAAETFAKTVNILLQT